MNSNNNIVHLMLIAISLAAIGPQFVKPAPPNPTPAAAAAMKAPADYDLQSVAIKAAAKVYGWLPADKQPRKLQDIEAAAKNAPKPPPADYDVERVAARAAAAVYGWLPAEQQFPLMMTDGLKRKVSMPVDDASPSATDDNAMKNKRKRVV